MAERPNEAKARAQAQFQAAAKKNVAADDKKDGRLAEEHVRDEKTARLKAQRLARDEADGGAAEAALKGTAEALRRKRS